MFTRILVLALTITAISACGGKTEQALPSLKDTIRTWTPAAAPATEKPTAVGSQKDTMASHPAGVSPAPGETVKISDDTGGFDLELPAGYSEPKKAESPVGSAVGELTMHSYTSQKGEDVCMIGYSEYPEAAFKNQTMKQMYDGARNGAVKNVKGRLVKEEDCTIDGKPGRSIWVDATVDGTDMHARFDYVASKPRVFFFAMVSKEQSALETPEARGYFKSFRFKH